LIHTRGKSQGNEPNQEGKKATFAEFGNDVKRWRVGGEEEKTGFGF